MRRILKESITRRNHRRSNRVVRWLLDWFAVHARNLPWRRTADPYAIWVAEVMLQQTQVQTVIPYWERWMRAWPTVSSLAQAQPTALHKLWEGLGYYRRVRNLHKAAQFILHQHHGQVPADFNSLLALPGIGRYTAGAICSIAFNQPKPVLDGNVTRVLTRLDGITAHPDQPETHRALWRRAEELVQVAAATQAANPSNAAGRRQRKSPGFSGASSRFNQALMELGALVCTPHRPDCPACPLQPVCVAFRTRSTHRLPNRRPSRPTTARHSIAFVIRRGHRYLIRQRPDGVVNAQLWEFPTLENTPPCPTPSQILGLAKTQFGCSFPAIDFLGTIQHAVTRYRITLHVYTTTAPEPAPRNLLHGQWLDLAELRDVPLSSAHRKVTDRLLPRSRTNAA